MKQRFARLLAGSVLAAAVSAAWAGETAEPGDVIRFEISRFDVSGNTLLAPADVERVVAPFAGRNRDFGDVQRALEALEELYHERGYNVVTVQLPEQELNGGVVRLQVVQTKIGKVQVSGNKAFSEQNIRRSLPTLQPGQTPNLKQVSANLKLANENPAKKISLGLSGGEADDEVDARVEVQDERPWKVMANLDNTGTAATGKTHAGVVLQHANLFGLDHVASLQYTTTVEHPDQVAVWGVGYHIPLYALGDSVDLFGSYSNVDSGTVSAGLFNLAVSGKGAVYGARYNQILARRGDYESRLVYGLDYKAYRNSVLLYGQDFGNNVTVHPLSVAYMGTLPLPGAEANFSISAAHNIAGGSRGSAADFERARSGAKAAFNLLRFSGAFSMALAGDWQARMLANGQYTADALVPGEQFGAGGSTSVRGFNERDLATDSGVLLNYELYTPNLCGKANWQCRLLAFYDTAYGKRNHTLPGELTSTAIASTGVGLRFAVGSSASIQLDYGHVLKEGALTGTSKNKLHVRVGLAY
ncbi:BamA/TamA family outer membrane protein [Massilia agilis]|uniref:BamA/TamA family outer membrane protein n=1 Tax=Massilia agilis TaxID=1811226 RepID=A0ABT2D7E7_9BURK|nr:ShlB/FhaC/HecB family hemolysin secretion/activation protein [Massilia agilis]MCS0807215.1 BamA/TamA family outer membrane protein [Massilia agilis]